MKKLILILMLMPLISLSQKTQATYDDYKDLFELTEEKVIQDGFTEDGDTTYFYESGDSVTVKVYRNDKGESITIEPDGIITYDYNDKHRYISRTEYRNIPMYNRFNNLIQSRHLLRSQMHIVYDDKPNLKQSFFKGRKYYIANCSANYRDRDDDNDYFIVHPVE